MPRRARIHLVSLRSSLVNLPISIYGPLVERHVRPQSLAVHMSLVRDSREHEKVEAFVGWTGMTSASSLARFKGGTADPSSLETIEIDPQFAMALGFKMGDIVEIGLLYDLPTATTVGAEPVTADDWDILELHADYVENNLLSQVRVAHVGQEVNVWVLGRTRVRLRIVSLDPSSAKHGALILTANTEVSIAPKSRTKPQKSVMSPKPRSKSHLATSAEPNPSSNSHSRVSRAVLRVLPSRLFSFGSTSAAGSVAWVSGSKFSQLTSTSYLDNPADPARQYSVTVRRLKPPSDPLTKTEEGADIIETENATYPDRLLLQWSDDIPSGHVLLQGVTGGVHDLDLVRISVSSDTSPTDISSAADLQAPRASSSSPSHNLAGVDELISISSKSLMQKFIVHSMQKTITGASGTLLVGRQGSGKTSLVQAIARSLQNNPQIYTQTVYLDLSKRGQDSASQLKSSFHYWYENAAWYRPCLVILDNIDKALGPEEENADSFRSRHLTELFLDVFSAQNLNARGIVLCATAESQSAIHPLLSNLHLFKDVIHLKPPGKEARSHIMAKLVQEIFAKASSISEDPAQPLNFPVLATTTEGYSANDLKDLVTRAVHQAAMRTDEDRSREPTTLIPADFEKAQVNFTPLSLRDVKLQKSDVNWSDIGGLHETRKVLRETLEWPTKYAAIFAKCPLRLRSGLLLYGFPGCGKTLLASAVAKECGLNFITVKGPELLNKYIGASEKSVRDLFERASTARPCVLFFDEFDSIAPKRGHDSTGVTDRVVNQLLTQMDGAEGLDGVYVLAATSRPDLIDSALLRPGRLDKSLLCDMPDLDERKDILQILCRKINLSQSVDLDYYAKITEGFSGADLQALVYNAQLEVIHTNISATTALTAKKTMSDDAETRIMHTTLNTTGTKSKAEEDALQRRMKNILRRRQVATKEHVSVPSISEGFIFGDEDLSRALRSTRPSVPFEEQKRLTQIYRAFMSNREGGLPSPSTADDVGSRASLM